MFYRLVRGFLLTLTLLLQYQASINLIAELLDFTVANGKTAEAQQTVALLMGLVSPIL